MRRSLWDRISRRQRERDREEYGHIELGEKIIMENDTGGKIGTVVPAGANIAKINVDVSSATSSTGSTSVTISNPTTLTFDNSQLWYSSDNNTWTALNNTINWGSYGVSVTNPLEAIKSEIHVLRSTMDRLWGELRHSYTRLSELKLALKKHKQAEGESCGK